jgi:hypothetical protein
VAEIDTGLTVTIGGATSHVQGPSFDGVTLSLGAIACGTNEAPPAIAVAGNSVTDVGVKGTSDEGVGVWASGSPAGHFESSKGYCVEAVGTADVDAINATTSSPHHAALAGHNNGGGFGLWAHGKTAGHFETDGSQGAIALEAFGLVNVNGTLTANPPVAGANAIMAFAASGAIAISATASAGSKAISTLGDVEVRGNHTVTGNVTAADVLLGGSDCAEDFDIATLAAVEPGTVMVFTDTGALEPSENAYDKKVAGVISGAGDYRPGLVLGRDGQSQNRMPLALVGKVYCKVDAQYGPIQVGDMLTTCPTPGHAMKASDPLKAFGSVIGKALRPLDSGQGLIPILVNLQ